MPTWGSCQALQMNITSLDNQFPAPSKKSCSLETELRIKKDRLAELQKEPRGNHAI